MPSASIIVPVYNKAPYLQTALDSIFAQTRRDFEVVIVDDGSTDASAHILASITDRRARIFRQANAGVSSARNLGICLARSEALLFFDADDWMHPDYLKHQLHNMAMHPGRAFFATTFRRFATGQPAYRPGLPVTCRPIVIDDLPAAWRAGQTFITSGVAVRRDALLAEASWFPYGESCGEDMDLWLRLAEKNGLVLLPSPLIAYREDAVGSLTGMRPATALPAYLARLEARAKAMPPALPLRRSSLDHVADARISLARRWLAQGRRLQCGRTLWAALPLAWRRPRWWVTLLMTALVPRRGALAWERYRIGRTQAWV
ncbi:glycosyltransferase [Xylophilus sp. Kf1]|nr:glycosyltransferase [Xylophilus sp. Kf1]